MTSNIFKFLLIALIVLSSTPSFCQEIKEKIKDVKGEASEITIKTDKGTYNFKGEDAKEMVNILRAFKERKYVFRHMPGNDFKFNIEMPPHPPMPHFIPEEENIDVNVEDGEVTVTIKKEKDGKESTQILKGEEAEKYLEKKAVGPHIKWFSDDGDSMEFNFRKFKDKAKELRKKIRIEIEHEDEDE